MPAELPPRTVSTYATPVERDAAVFRTCTKCHMVAPLSAFPPAGKPSRPGSWCRDCKREHLRQWKARNPDHWREWLAKNHDRVRARQAAWRSETRATRLPKQKSRKDERLAAVRALKERPCTDCGGSFPPECMDFDHVGEGKRRSVSAMVRYSWDLVLTEIAKCELVCANCHRIRTAKRGWGKQS